MDKATTDRATLLIAAPSATVGFALAFNLGAFDVVFFDSIFAMWVLATTVLVASLISPTLPPRHWVGRILLLIPSGWLALSWLHDPAAEDEFERFVLGAGLVVTAIVFPFIAWILISAINPDFLALPNINKGVIVGAVLAFAIAGYLIGARNDVFLSCQDFKISGNDLPTNCVNEPGASSSLPRLQL